MGKHRDCVQKQHQFALIETDCFENEGTIRTATCPIYA